MICERRGDRWVVWAPAKVNLYLEVLGKRPDGYHEIATLMVAVSLYDQLEFAADDSGDVRLRCDRPELSTGPDNLICRAAELLRRRYGGAAGARVRLRKRIPLAAGLAGGSTDAAATLVGLNQLWGLDRPREELMTLAAELGSDVPFFLDGPAAWCTGRGERVEPLTLGRRLWLVVVYPEVGLSTAEVYRRVVVPAAPDSGAAMRQAAGAGDAEEIGRRLHNRLGPAALRVRPELAELRERMAGLGPAGWLMSGSGSSHFALCRDRREARRVARALRHGPGKRSYPQTYLVSSCV